MLNVVKTYQQSHSLLLVISAQKIYGKLIWVIVILMILMMRLWMLLSDAKSNYTDKHIYLCTPYGLNII